ncbi:hypothetical protein G9A89_001330 [Geosiphon pyriformis]|nr:hypothetical protein G9A89_001330 [Geosiphon pyriformis]
MAGWQHSVCSLFNWHCIFNLDLMLDDVSSAKLVFTGKNVLEIVEQHFEQHLELHTLDCKKSGMEFGGWSSISVVKYPMVVLSGMLMTSPVLL